MTIYIAPDRTAYPDNLQSTVSPELETLTGADMLISSFPFELDTSTLEAHIKARGLFVQIKIGYDVLNFEGLHNFCARVQKCHIPKNQAILLRIGDYWRDNEGLLRVKGSKPYGNTTWRDYRKAMIACELRGVTVFPECLQSMDELADWIEDYQSIIDKISNEGTRELYPTRYVPNFEQENIWQDVIEVDKSDPRYIMVAGLDKFGEVKAKSTYDYICQTFPDLVKIEYSDGQTEYTTVLYHFWKVLTDEDKGGKPLHNVPKWGDKSRKDFRRAIGLQDGFNLTINHVDWQFDNMPYKEGWIQALKTFHSTIERLASENGGKLNGKIVQEAFDFTMKQSELVIEF